eukprot:CAMPEP_0174722662 /NCGR_PEP_ID=MMETSP1094-20130205/38965_1 /TAXON_ID=156173 /ORGANISM="Chrysochromulina brevifilum, Strain UTEX LB 985" /LENGTH=133 /DNA_ID=CAMNT_0015923559 /DNA_START=41 /DNA_END=442 /DNA_ORIENTATION=+
MVECVGVGVPNLAEVPSGRFEEGALTWRTYSDVEFSTTTPRTHPPIDDDHDHGTSRRKSLFGFATSLRRLIFGKPTQPSLWAITSPDIVVYNFPASITGGRDTGSGVRGQRPWHCWRSSMTPRATNGTLVCVL